jgi:hypothetical protein
MCHGSDTEGQLTTKAEVGGRIQLATPISRDDKQPTVTILTAHQAPVATYE